MNFSFRIELLHKIIGHIGCSIDTYLNTAWSDIRMFLPFLHEVVYVVNWLRELLLLMIDHQFLLGLKRSQKATLEQPHQ